MPRYGLFAIHMALERNQFIGRTVFVGAYGFREDYVHSSVDTRHVTTVAAIGG